MSAEKWFAARCFFLVEAGAILPERGQLYEERITLWHTQSAEQAIEKARGEAEAYAAANQGFEYVDYIDTYELLGEPAEGGEVWSFMRDSWLAPAEYVGHFVIKGDPDALPFAGLDTDAEEPGSAFF
jgi:hypothetical protein